MKRKSAIEQALDYSAKTTTFVFEDTYDRCYRDIIEVLELCGWKKSLPKKRSKLVEKKKYAYDDRLSYYPILAHLKYS